MLYSIAITTLSFLAEHVFRFLFSEFIELTYNPGAAFGIFKDVPGLSLALSCVACAVILGVLVFMKLDKLERLGLSIMLGGALSNLCERIFLGHVIDWIPLPFFELNFNIADVEISLGALIAFVSFTLSQKYLP